MKQLRKIKNLVLFEIILGLVLVTFSTAYGSPGEWTPRDYPGASETRIYGIDGSTLVGSFKDTSDRTHGFLYNGTTWAAYDAPEAYNTSIYGIDGSKLVGAYDSHGFLYNGTTWTNVDVEGNGTTVYGIDGSNMVGVSETIGLTTNGFFYDGTTYTTLIAPGATFGTWARGIQGSDIVGYYYSGSTGKYEGFLYDGTNWTAILAPAATNTYVYGIDGSNLVGSFKDPSGNYHGFLYTGTTWTTIDIPGKANTRVYGIDGSNIVGTYTDASGTHGFVYEIPEPVTVFLLGLGVILARKKPVR